jgi:WD40 repeat protein
VVSSSGRTWILLCVSALLIAACAAPMPSGQVKVTNTPAMITQPSEEPTIPPLPTKEPTPKPSAEPLPKPASPTQTPTPQLITPENVTDIVPLLTLSGHEDDVTDVAFSPDNALVASASLDGTVRIWRTADGGLERILEGHEDHVLSVAFSPDGETLATASDDRTVKLWRVRDGELIRTIQSWLMGRALVVEYSPDGYLLAIGGHQCFVELRSADSGILRRTLAQPSCVVKHYGSVGYFGVAFSPDGSEILTGEGRPCCGGSIQSWVVEEIKEPELERGYDLVIRDLAYAPDGEHVAIALVGSPFYWLVSDGDFHSPEVMEGHVWRVNSLDFSPDSQLILSGSRDYTLRLWSVEGGEAIHILEGHVDGVNNAAFSPDGSLIASGSEDDTVILWGLPSP